MPALPPMLYDFNSTEVYDGGFLQLDAEDRSGAARVVKADRVGLTTSTTRVTRILAR